MICNNCDNKNCKDKAYQDSHGVWRCPDNKPPKGGWPLEEIAAGHPQGFHDALSPFNYKLKGGNKNG